MPVSDIAVDAEMPIIEKIKYKQEVMVGGNPDDVRKKGARYKASQMQPFRVNSFEELTEDGGKLLLKLIKDFQENHVPRFDRLDDYYMAENTDIYAKQSRTQTHSSAVSDHRISHSFGEFITSFLTSYIAGKPLTYNIAQGGEGEINHDIATLIEEFNSIADIDLHNYEVFTDASIYGEGMELLYRVEEDGKTIDKAALLPRMQSFLIYDMTLENNIIAGVYFYSNKIGDEVKNYILLYSDTDVWECESYSNGADKVVWKDQQKIHVYGEVPLVEYKNNRHALGDYERVIPAIDAYDAAVSDTANYMTDLTDALLVILGTPNKDMSRDEVENIRRAKMLFLEPRIDLTGRPSSVDAKYLYKQYDVAGVEAHKRRLENDIHKLSYTPNFSDEKFGGHLSGEALSYKLIGLEQAKRSKTTYFTKGLKRRYRMLARANGIDESKIQEIDFIFHQNLPKAVLEELKVFAASGGQLSQKSMLSLLSFIENPDDEMAQIQKELEEQLGDLTGTAYPQWETETGGD